MPARHIPQTHPPDTALPQAGDAPWPDPKLQGGSSTTHRRLAHSKREQLPGSPCILQRCSPCQGCSPSHAASHVLSAPEGSTREPKAEQQPGPGARRACRGWGDARGSPRKTQGREERPRCPPVPSSWLWTQLRHGTPPPSPSGMGTRQGPVSRPRPGAGSRPHTSDGCERRCG